MLTPINPQHTTPTKRQRIVWILLALMAVAIGATILFALRLGGHR
jgi:hypothetical protein